MEMGAIRYFRLMNQGAFICRLHVNYRPGGEESWKTWEPAEYADIYTAAERTVDMKELGIEDGTHVRLIAFIVSGSHQIAAEEYIFYSNIGRTAAYKASGTLLSSRLNLVRYG